MKVQYFIVGTLYIIQVFVWRSSFRKPIYSPEIYPAIFYTCYWKMWGLVVAYILDISEIKKYSVLSEHCIVNYNNSCSLNKV